MTDKYREPVLRLDHIAIKSSSPEKLFLFFTEILGLPVIWPVSKEPGFTTGGFFVGNANMSTISHELASAPDSALAVLAFESRPFDEISAQLRGAGLRPSEPEQAIKDYDGRQARAWTSMRLEALSGPGYSVCLREYDKDYHGQLGKTISFPTPLGAAGLLGMKEIRLNSSAPEKASELWASLLGVKPTADGLFERAGMPLLRILRASNDGIESLVLKVQSLEKTRGFLKEKRLLGTHDASSASIEPRAVQGLRITFSQ